MSDAAAEGSGDPDNTANTPPATTHAGESSTGDVQLRLDELKASIEGKDGDERADMEKKMKELQEQLDKEPASGSVEAEQGGAEDIATADIDQASSKSKTSVTEGTADTGAEDNPTGNTDTAGNSAERAAMATMDDAAADKEPEDTLGDGDGEEKPAAEEETTEAAAAMATEDNDAADTEVEFKLNKEDEVSTAKDSEPSATPSGKKSGRDSERSMSRSGSRVSQRSGKTPSRSGKGRKRMVSSPDVLKDIPQLRKRGGAGGISEPLREDEELRSSNIVADPLERVVGPIFRRADVNNDKLLSLEEIFRVFRSPELGLDLSKEDLLAVKQSLGLTDDSKLTFHQFIPLAQRILMRVYQQQDPESMDEWMELMTSEGDMVWFNRFTGEASFNIPDGYSTDGGEANLIEHVIREIFAKADVDHTGYLSKDEFIRMLQSNELGLLLSESEILQIASSFDINQDGKITFEEFVPLAKTLIMTLYQRRDPSPGEWCRLNSRQAGLFWFNKRTGETRRQPPQEVSMQQQAEEEARQQNMLFVEQALSELEGVQYDLEAERQQREEVEYQLAAVEEEADVARLHLEETGKRLDEANEKLTEHEAVITDKENTIVGCNTKITELEQEVSQLEVVKAELEQAQSDLHDSRTESEERAVAISDRDAKIASLQEQIAKLTVELRGQTSIVREQESVIEDLSTRLGHEEARNRNLEDELMQMPVLEGELQKTETVLMQTQKHLDEKASALTVTRKNLRNVKDKNSELEDGLNVVSELRDKLHASRCEVHTLRQFVGGKTALVLQRERELDTVKQRMKEMEEKDGRRAQVLASVLEKTARLQQDGRGKMAADGHIRSHSVGNDQNTMDRPLSCPALVPVADEFDEEDYAHTFGAGAHDSRTVGTASTVHSRGLTTRGMSQITRSPTKLPPVSRVSRRPDTRSPQKVFIPITPADVKARQRHADARLAEPLFPANVEPGRTLKSIPISYALPEDDEAAADSVAAQQLRTGDRVLVRRKRMPWESESGKSSGLVRYIGRVDSEFVDNRIYVGIQLDSADGEHDGVVKGKRYFKCGAKRGLLVRITEVTSVLAPKSLVYRPLIFNDMATAITA